MSLNDTRKLLTEIYNFSSEGLQQFATQTDIKNLSLSSLMPRTRLIFSNAVIHYGGGEAYTDVNNVYLYEQYYIEFSYYERSDNDFLESCRDDDDLIPDDRIIEFINCNFSVWDRSNFQIIEEYFLGLITTIDALISYYTNCPEYDDPQGALFMSLKLKNLRLVKPHMELPSVIV